jgi:hypothetical protein
MQARLLQMQVYDECLENDCFFFCLTNLKHCEAVPYPSVARNIQPDSRVVYSAGVFGQFVRVPRILSQPLPCLNTTPPWCSHTELGIHPLLRQSRHGAQSQRTVRHADFDYLAFASGRRGEPCKASKTRRFPKLTHTCSVLGMRAQTIRRHRQSTPPQRLRLR